MADLQNYNSSYTGPEIDQSVGAVLEKETDWDAAYAGKMPAGGEAGQVLEKTGSEDNAAAWRTPPAVVRPNMLTNAYFVGGGSQQGDGIFPINQRGETIVMTKARYAMDMWQLAGGNGDCSVEILADCARISNPASSGSSWVQQRIRIPAGTFTFSVLAKAVTGSAYLVYMTSGGAITPSQTSRRISGAGVTEYKQTLTDGQAARVAIYMSAGASLDIEALKLEQGENQTVARLVDGVWVVNEIPNFDTELLKCQRHFQTFRTEALRPTYGADCRPAMPAEEPTKGTITLDGVTYYTLTA